MKIEYQREAFREVISEEAISSKFDAFSYNEKLKESARESQGVNEWFLTYVYETFKNFNELLEKVLNYFEDAILKNTAKPIAYLKQLMSENHSLALYHNFDKLSKDDIMLIIRDKNFKCKF